ncbi:SDR family NAD(P)-dependent oxidoreductase [Streptomyces camelliae]|uniref:SDR family NAD(P)-dependent oxidoreductase n=1 Tax=Streptomyces camelliae TaxID=3004093 RepID=A0ABY7P1H0_9ACTN|nr:SDR family NAD(P)-dependent oxidoreductase [Streptomyces sp. HUAS 2-6]WBO63193.1 SDR family NAD(P)-dependent oxidoreductase [Streptomyces sp. HUAS 2-6]
MVGAAGSCGTHLPRAARRAPFRARAVVHGPTGRRRVAGLGVHEVSEADLADPDAVRQALENADFVYMIPPAFHPEEDLFTLLTLHAVAPVQLVRAALPGMLSAEEGAVVTVASLLAFNAGGADPRLPRRTLYLAAEAATLGFTRTLAGELAGTPVRVQVVCPGVVATDWNNGAGRDLPWAMSPEDVASAGLAGLRLGEAVCVPGLEGQAAALDALLAAGTALLAGGNRPALAARYTDSRA